MNKIKWIVSAFGILTLTIVNAQVINPISTKYNRDLDYLGADGNEIFGVQSIRKSSDTYLIQLSTQNIKGWEYHKTVSVSTKTDSLHITDVAKINENIYISGNFKGSGDYQNIIRYNTTTEKWDFPIEFSNASTVLSLASLKTDLVIGGGFRSCNKTICNNICTFDGSTTITAFEENGTSRYQ